MSDKPGLICPICDEGLATLEPTAKANLIVQCLRCGYVFPFVQGPDFPRLLCGNACAWVEPYGWVPEDGCPVHDPEEHNAK